MELLITLFVLYGAQCLIILQRGGSAVIRPLSRWRITVGPGWQMLHPRPAGPSFIATRFFLEEGPEGLRGRERPTRFGLPSASFAKPPLDLASIERLQARGRIVHVNGLAFCRAESKNAAKRVAELLRELAEAAPDGARERIASEIEASLSLSDYAEESERLSGAVRALGWLLDGYFFTLFIFLPSLFVIVHSELALLLAFPVVLLAHVASLVAVVIAYRRLYPGDFGELTEQLISAAVYPPLLLRTVVTLRIEWLSRFHPAVHAVALLGADERCEFLRREIRAARFASAHASDQPSCIGLAEMERVALEKLVVESGESLEALLAPLDKVDPFALAYCPLCACEYVRIDGDCVDCKVPLVSFSE